jgi:hypothetical protein
MRKLLLGFTLCLLAISAISAQTLAFPGADGFGRFAKGARAAGTPSIYHVTNLNDSGTGSFRDAISQPNRIVVFDVGGIIKISTRLVFSKNLTIAGQTAPGDGISIYGNGVSFSGADNIIVRYLRMRMGLKGDSGKDAAGIANGSNMIFDHISVGWGSDENFSISWDNKGTEPGNITIQNSIIGQGIMVHSAGGLIQTSGGVSILKNLYIDNKTRNPKVKGLNQFVNNVVYNWGSGGGYILGDSEGPSWGVIDNNYFIKGPSTGGTEAFVRANANFQICHKGNMLDYNVDGTLNGNVAVDSDFGPGTFVANVDAFTNAPLRHPDLTNVLTASQAYTWIVDSVGACIPSRDEVDKYMLNELTSLGTIGALINGESDLGLPNGVGNVFSAPKLSDTDNDGMPDVWEDANGLDKTDPSDALLVHTDGYLNIERYINGISAGAAFVKYPTLLNIKGIDTDFIFLKWSNHATASTAVVLEQSTNNSDFTEIARLDATAIEYKVANLTPNTTYYFRLKTINGETESMYTTSLKATTTGVASPPVACSEPNPADQSIISSYSQATLSWTNVTGNWAGVLSYDVFVGKTETELVQVATNISAASYTLALEPATTFFWRVDATNLMGEQEGDVWSFTTGNKPEREKVAYWKFDETEGLSATNEVQGYATAQNFTPTWNAGKIDNCVTIPSAPTNAAFVQGHYDAISLGNESFSLEMWFKSSGGAFDWYLIHKGSHALNSSTGATGKWFGIQYNKTGSNDRLTWGIDDNITKTDLSITGSTYFDNQWHHLVAIRDIESDMIKLYVDGALKGSKADGTGNIAQTESIVIGNTNVNFVNAFGGSIDDVSIYKGALTAEEILDNYNKGLQTAIIPVTANNSVQTYPNPFVNELVIKSDKLTDNSAQVQFYTVAGQLVYSKQVNVSNNTITVKGLNNLASGVYICVVKSTGKETLSARIVK